MWRRLAIYLNSNASHRFFPVSLLKHKKKVGLGNVEKLRIRKRHIKQKKSKIRLREQSLSCTKLKARFNLLRCLFQKRKLTPCIENRPQQKGPFNIILVLFQLYHSY